MTIADQLKTAVEQQVGAGQHHAYLFASRSFAAEKTPIEFVTATLWTLSGLRLFESHQRPSEDEFWDSFTRHPDLLRADPARSILRKDDVELFRERSLYPATFARRRFLLIERAERMNTQSANALLKTLEEPLAQCVFVLTSARPQQLPPTIASRCQKILLPAWDAGPKSALKELEPEDAEFLSKLFSGEHLLTPPTLLPGESLVGKQKNHLSARTLSELSIWCDAAGKKYSAQILRDAVVESTSTKLKAGKISHTRVQLLMSEIKRWTEVDPFNPTASLWLMRILLTLAH